MLHLTCFLVLTCTCLSKVTCLQVRVETSKTNMSGCMKISFEFFVNGAKLLLNSVISANSGNLINHWSMNEAQFKYHISYKCLAGTVVASWFLKQEVAGFSPFNYKYFLSLNLLNSVKTFWKSSNFYHKTICLSVMFQLSLVGIKCLRGKGIIARLSDLDWNSMSQANWHGTGPLKSTVVYQRSDSYEVRFNKTPKWFFTPWYF